MEQKTFKFITNRSGSKSISKTLIVCNNINQSKSIKSYLDSIGLFSVISNSENDTKSELIQDFKHNKINILIVVNRARLGYDDTDLINLIDMSGTLNPNLIYQMMARVLRGSNDSQKYYIRLTSKKDDLLNSEISTSLALMLTDKKYISTFNGKDFSSKKIIVPNYFYKKNISKSTDKGASSKILKDTDDIISFYRDTLIEVEKNAGIYKFCEVQDVLNFLNPKNKKHTLEMCKISAIKFQTRSEWAKKDTNLYCCAVRKKWLDECCKHMKVLSRTYTLNDCKISASKYKTKSEWAEKDKKLHGYASKKGWITECCKHMKVLSRTHTLNDCKISASKYKTRSEWAEKETNLYYYARKNGYLKECCNHMNILKKKHTLEMCKKSASKYKSRVEWEKKDRKSYIYASKKGWKTECCKHMRALMNKNTLSDCKNDALKCESKIEWSKKYPSTYNYARRNKLMTECCKHMKILKTTHTLSSCKKIALKYKSRNEWHKNNNKSYSYACRNGFLDKCCQHMNQKKTKLCRS